MRPFSCSLSPRQGTVFEDRLPLFRMYFVARLNDKDKYCKVQKDWQCIAGRSATRTEFGSYLCGAVHALLACCQVGVHEVLQSAVLSIRGHKNAGTSVAEHSLYGAKAAPLLCGDPDVQLAVDVELPRPGRPPNLKNGVGQSSTEEES
jgi:hypothetical protein